MKSLFPNNKSKALVLGFFIFAIVFSSCKKDDNGDNGANDYVMKFKANGSQVVLNSQPSLVATFANAGAIFNGVFNGSDGASIMILQVYDSKNISETNYIGYKLVGSSFIGAVISYNDASGTGYAQGSVNPDTKVTISEITTTTVRGTFSATLKSAGKPDIAITDGEFFVWRAN